MGKSLTSILSILVLSLFSCQKQASEPKSVNMAESSNTTTLNDDSALIEKIKTFSEDVGEPGQKALAYMLSLPRNELIRDLLRLRDDLPPDDSLRPQIAFVLCHLDYEYESNAEIVASALSRNGKYKTFYGDQAASLIGRLIKRGDRKLLAVLLTSVPWSDGALAEELGVILGSELANNTEPLLVALDEQPEEIRLKVYKLIHATGALKAEEKQQLENHLRKIKPNAGKYRLAQEILKSVVMN